MARAHSAPQARARALRASPAHSAPRRLRPPPACAASLRRERYGEVKGDAGRYEDHRACVGENIRGADWFGPHDVPALPPGCGTQLENTAGDSGMEWNGEEYVSARVRVSRDTGRSSASRGCGPSCSRPEERSASTCCTLPTITCGGGIQAEAGRDWTLLEVGRPPAAAAPGSTRAAAAPPTRRAGPSPAAGPGCLPPASVRPAPPGRRAPGRFGERSEGWRRLESANGDLGG